MQATTCWRCGKPPTADDPLERDHIQAVVDGGADIATNYAAAHRSCNRRAGAAHINGGVS